jgi:hypothetical protein
MDVRECMLGICGNERFVLMRVQFVNEIVPSINMVILNHKIMPSDSMALLNHKIVPLTTYMVFPNHNSAQTW